jgi:arylsulfatase A-like enzyme
MTSARHSLILVTVDCLRADHVGFLGYQRPTTPFLDALAQQSIVFSNAIVAGTPTYFSFPAIMASRHPLALGRDLVGLASHEITLAKVLQDEMYATAAFVAGNPYLTPRFGYDTGFDVFRDHIDPDLDAAPSENPATGSLRKLNQRLSALAHKNGVLRSVYDDLYFEYCQRVASAPAESLDRLRRFPSADVIVDEACSWLADQGDQPFFLWLHLMDAHSPYYPQEAALQQMSSHPISASQARYTNSYWNRGDLAPVRLESRRKDVMTLYDAGIRWVDSQIARLVDTLRSSNRWSECVLAVTADHGEEFLDHGGRFHAPANLHEELIRVPLLLRVPNATTPANVTSPFSLLNLAPTLLDCMEVSPPNTFRGSSRWSNIEGAHVSNDLVVTESIAECSNPFRAKSRMGSRVLAVRGSRFKLIVNFGDSKDSLFDLASDSGESHPLAVNSERGSRSQSLEIARSHITESMKGRNSDLVLSARIHEIQRQWSRPAYRASA